MINSQTLIKIAAYCTVIHHIKGRIRLRINPKIKEISDNITLEDIESLPKKIEGIKSIKINKIIGSLTVEYDNDVFPFDLWEDLIYQRNIETLVTLINKLKKEIA